MSLFQIREVKQRDEGTHLPRHHPTCGAVSAFSCSAQAFPLQEEGARRVGRVPVAPKRGWLLSLDTQRRLASPPHSPPRADKETGERKSRPSPGAHSPTCVAVWTRKPHLSVTVPLGLRALGDPGDTPPHE